MGRDPAEGGNGFLFHSMEMGVPLVDRTSKVNAELNSSNQYDVVIAGGGLAGLALSIQLARAGYSVALFEKETYPFHKVCGEYISLESWNFLEELGLPLSDWGLPVIRRLLVSAPNGESIEHELPLGGFGISRYKIDAALADIARTSGVVVEEGSKVMDVVFEQSAFRILSSSGEYRAKVACVTAGKRSSLDIKWKRPFTRKRSDKLNNYVAVKYHVQFIGDEAGMVAPLSGNGMSMALHGSKIAFRCIDGFLRDHVARHEMEQEYEDQWSRQFGRRLWVGRQLQRWFGNEKRTN